MKKHILATVIVLSITLALTSCGKLNSQGLVATSPALNEPMESVDTTSADTTYEELMCSSAIQELSEPKFTYYADENSLPKNEPDIVNVEPILLNDKEYTYLMELKSEATKAIKYSLELIARKRSYI